MFLNVSFVVATTQFRVAMATDSRALTFCTNASFATGREQSCCLLYQSIVSVLWVPIFGSGYMKCNMIHYGESFLSLWTLSTVRYFKEHTTFRKLDLFPSSGVKNGGKIPTQLGPLERANLSQSKGVSRRFLLYFSCDWPCCDCARNQKLYILYCDSDLFDLHHSVVSHHQRRQDDRMNQRREMCSDFIFVGWRHNSWVSLFGVYLYGDSVLFRRNASLYRTDID
jgi:hypothetical protein